VRQVRANICVGFADVMRASGVNLAQINETQPGKTTHLTSAGTRLNEMMSTQT
jgi:hypothetical protein